MSGGLPTQVLLRAERYLERHGVEGPRVSAEALLAATLGTDRAGLYTRAMPLSQDEARAFGRALCRRREGEPLQHITGEQAFRRLSLTVRLGVFVPRPETEVLVDLALAELIGVDSPLVVDVGTGTGAIALAIADERRDAQVLAIDISPDAVALAEENARELDLPVEVIAGDLLALLPHEMRGEVDLVVSNPPYIRPEEMERLSGEVLADPITALVGDLELVTRLASEARDVLRPGGALVMEIGETQGSEVTGALKGAGFAHVRVEVDLTGRDRVVIAS